MPTPRPEPTAPRSYHFPSFDPSDAGERHAARRRAGAEAAARLDLGGVDAGATTERDGEEGVAALTAQLLLEGAAGMDGAALTDRFERIGTSVEAHADWDAATVSLTVLARAAARGARARARSAPRARVSRARGGAAQGRATRGAAAASRRARVARRRTVRARRVCTDGALCDAGRAASATSVRALTRDVVREFYARRYRPSTTTLVLAGDVTVEGARALARAAVRRLAGR